MTSPPISSQNFVLNYISNSIQNNTRQPQDEMVLTSSASYVSRY